MREWIDPSTSQPVLECDELSSLSCSATAGDRCASRCTKAATSRSTPKLANGGKQSLEVRRLDFAIGWLLFLMVITPVASADADTAKQNEKPFGIEKRVLWTTSRVIGRPDPPHEFTIERVFPKLKFKQPLFLIPEPNSQRLLAIEWLGKIHRIADKADATTTELFLDVKRRTYSIAFHPQYRANGFVYVFSELKAPKSNRRRISRFRVSRDKQRICDPASEETVIEFTSRGHMGGDMTFGPDGMLYITTGDGTVFGDSDVTGQDLSDLRSAILRIDVDHPDKGKLYGIPKDNPFVNLQDARPEIWAFGLRNPWRFSFDRPTGRMWIGDVGEDRYEMIYIGRRGGNYGWSIREGSHPFVPDRKRGPGEFETPLAEHPHSEARSIVGGFVYHGPRLKQLRGAYIYADHMTGKIWGLRYDGERVTWKQELADTAVKIISFCELPDGELLIVAFSGEIYRLQPAPPVKQPHSFPRRLSDTGLFASVADHKLAPGLIPYSVNAPLWSDAAHKQRFIGLPGDAKINHRGRRGWAFPERTVLVKTFSLDVASGDPASRRRVETRLLTYQNGDWYGYSYQWNDAQTDAVLVGKAGAKQTFAIRDAKSGDLIRKQQWQFPSRAECMLCHTRVTYFVLGLSTLQMNKDHDYGAVTDNQLRTLNHIGVFSSPVTPPTGAASRLANPYDESANLDARARSYLHANCAQCHINEGGGNARMKLEFTNKRPDTGIFGIVGLHKLDNRDLMLIAPGDPEQSAIYKRIARRGRGRMPPLASSVVDEGAVRLFAQWIKSLPPPAPPLPEK